MSSHSCTSMSSSGETGEREKWAAEGGEGTWSGSGNGEDGKERGRKDPPGPAVLSSQACGHHLQL